MFGHGAGLDFSGGQPQPTRTGAKVSGARNPDFRLRSDWQKATIIPRQHGYQGTIKRPTLFLAGEGGRPEDVTVRPRGSAQRGGSGGGTGGSSHITISFEPQEFMQFLRYRINDNQGVVK